MARDIPESDWKIFRQLNAIALRRFCRRTLSEIEGNAAEHSKSSYQRYLAAYETQLRRENELSRAFDGLRRSTAILRIAGLRSRAFIDDEEFVSFSKETRRVNDLLINRRVKCRRLPWMLNAQYRRMS